jgi:hypothetical protein
MQEIYAEFTFKMKAVWLIIIAVLLISGKGYAQNEYGELPKTNLNAFQEITGKKLSELEDVITLLGKEKVYKITIEENSEQKDFLLNELKQKFGNFKFVYVVSDSVDFKIRFSNLKFSTKYTNLKAKKFLGDEYISRELTSSFRFSVDGNDIRINNNDHVFKDEVKVDKLEYIESGNYAFLKSVLPEKPFLKKILVPAVIVAVSAIATILFFTIRSK